MSKRLIAFLAITTVAYTWQLEQGQKNTIQSHLESQNRAARNAIVVPDVHNKGCTPNDFEPNRTCSLECTVSTANTDYLLIEHTFKYYTTDFHVYVDLPDATYVDNVPDSNYTASLTLNRYNSGYYQCQWVFGTGTHDDVIYPTATFKISTTPGVTLHSDCNGDSDCMTLDATCDPPTPNTGRKTCNCRGAHHISFNNQADSPACLASLSAPTNCSTDAQCRDISRMYICRESKCTCPYDTRTNPHACDEAETKMKSGVQSFFDKLSGKQIVILTLVGSGIAIPSFVIILWSLFHFEGFISVPTPCGNCTVGQERQDSQQEGGRKCCPCFRSGDNEITNESTNEQSSLLENEANGEQPPPNSDENGENNITSQQQIPFLQRITACPCFRCLHGASSPLNVISNVTNGDSGLLNDSSGSIDNVISEGSGAVNNLASSLNSVVSGESSPINIPNVTNDHMRISSNDEHGETNNSINDETSI